MLKYFRIIPLFLIVPCYISAQCCSPGTPSLAGEIIGQNRPNELKFYTSYEYGVGTTYYQGTSSGFDGPFESAFYHQTLVGIDFAFLKSLSASSGIGYAPYRERTHSLSELTETANGISDIQIGVRYVLIPFVPNGIGTQAELSVLFPPSFSIPQSNGTSIVPELRPSANSIGFRIESTSVYQNLSRKFQIFAKGLFEGFLPDEDNFKRGNRFNIEASVSHPRTMNTINLGITHDVWQSDVRGTVQDPNSGRQFTSLLIGMQFNILRGKHILGVRSKIPFWGIYDGLQLANLFSISINYQWASGVGFSIGQL